ncbi:MAG: TIGR00159 family protein [Chlorobi bacterium]|nr:TIGR00159 family protein [Chlorobiota bacterium]
MTTLFIEFRILDIVDIVLVATLLFAIYQIVKGTAAINIVLGLISLFLMWRLFSFLEMELLSEILGAFISVGLVALIIIFQPEIRQFLFALGTPTFFNKYGTRFNFLKPLLATSVELSIDSLITACRKMAAIKQGALIVITKQNELKQYVNTGDVLDAMLTTSILENIFFKNSPLHDGAVIITNNRIVSAKCILPVSKKRLADAAGLRHRAALGITEISDCMAIVVSEETGHISYSIQGQIFYNVNLTQLHEVIVNEFNMKDADKEDKTSS